MFKIGNLVKDINPGWVNYNNKGRIVSISGDTIIWLNNRTNRFTIDNKKNLHLIKSNSNKVYLTKGQAYGLASIMIKKPRNK